MGTVGISNDEQELMFLETLRAAGVDNWEGYDEAVDIYKEWLNELETEVQNDLSSI